tara:strand:- start:7696 stop:7827 length:132 start_codon:yes stop_codon:yes gene_type:complete
MFLVTEENDLYYKIYMDSNHATRILADILKSVTPYWNNQKDAL